MSGDSANLTMAGALAGAARLGLTIRYPKENELFLDIDSEEDFTRFLELFTVLIQNSAPGHNYDAWPSKSGLPKRHVVVTLPHPVVNEMGRVTLQAILGSDRKRELLSWLAITKDLNPEPTLFFEKVPAVVDGTTEA